MKKTKIYRIILLILIILWAVTVFILSNQKATNSSGFSLKIVKIFIKDEEMALKFEPYARKLAHYLEYCYGGALICLLINTYEFTEKKKILYSILIGAWYASLDEVHQLMVEGRVRKYSRCLYRYFRYSNWNCIYFNNGKNI